MRVKIFTIIFLSVFLSGLQAQTPITGGDISGTWTAVNSPYMIQGNCNIIDLTIEPGVEVQFVGDYKLEVVGRFQAQGFYSDSIIFKPLSSNPQGWVGIKFKNTAYSSALAYCRIEGASEKGAIQIDTRAPDLSHCRIVNNQSDGIYVKDASIQINNCIISNNTMNGILLDGGQVTATNIIIAGNTLSGITATHNDDSAVLTNSVIANNGIYGIVATNGVVTVQNSIIYGNLNSINGTIQASYSCIEGASEYPGTGNINSNPQFRDNILYDIGPQSPCIDAGTTQILQSDRYFPPSQGQIRNDMGAYGGPGAGGWYPPLYIVPRAYDFGQVTLDSSQSVTLEVYNYRDVPISAVLMTFIPGTPNVFSTDFTPFTVPVSSYEQVGLSFTPSAVQSFSANMVTLTSAHGTVSIPVQGEGVVSDIDIAMDQLDFGAVSIGDSLNLPLQIRNTGNDTLRLTAQPPVQSVFSIDRSNFNIEPNGGTASIQVKFKPVLISDYQDSILIFSNDPDENPVIVNLAGTGSGAHISVNPDTIDFDSVSIGSFSDRSLTILNSGNSALIISEIQSENPRFEIADSTLSFPLTIEPAGSLDLEIRFTPMILGTVSGQIRIRSNSIGSGQIYIHVNGTGTGALLQLSSDFLDFGNVPLFSDSVQQIILHSAGNEPVVVQDIIIDNITADSVFTVVNSNLSTPFILLPTVDTTLTIRFEAKNIGRDSGRVDILWDHPDIETSVFLAGTGQASVISLIQDSLNFGDTYLPFDSVQSLTLQNTGNAELIIQSLDFIGQSPDSVVFFAVNAEDSLPLTILPGDSLDLELRFRPLREGYVYSDLVINTNDPRTPAVTVFLNGNGLIPSLLLSEADLDFGSVNLYTESDKSIRLTNKGNTPIAIQSLSIIQDGTDFQIIDSALTFPLNLDLEEMVDITIKFTPSLRGSLTGEFIITSDSPGLEQITVDLIGVGRGSKITYTPSALNFFTVIIGRESIRGLTITNPGNDTLIIDEIHIADQHPDSLVFDTLSVILPLSVPPDSSTSLPIVFRPLSEGLITSYLELFSNDPDSSTVSVRLDGTGISSAPILTVSPREIYFGDVQVSASWNAEVLIENTGTEDLVISDLQLNDSNPDTVLKLITSIVLPFPVRPDSSIELTLQFSPNREGIESGLLRITSNDPTTPLDSVFLQGTGIAPFPIIQLSTHTLDFNRVLVNEDSLLTVRVWNYGYFDLIIPRDSIKFTTPDENNFILGNIADISIAPADSDSILIQFQPQSSGLYSNSIRLVSNDPENPVQQIILSGEGYVDETASISFDPLYSSSSFIKGQPATISFIISDVSSVDSALIYLKNGGARQYRIFPLTAHVNGQNWYRQISASQVTERGLEYYVCVFHNNDSTLFPAAGSILPQSIQVIVPEQQFPQSTQKSKYQMISIPLVTGGTYISSFNLFGDDLGPYDDTIYRLFEVVNGSSYTELSSMNIPLAPGQAVWLITKNQTELDISNAQSVPTSGNFSLSLTEGWNLVGSPFVFAVDWRTVSDEFKLRNYTSSGWGFTDLLPPYGGCAVYVPRDTVLLIPPQEAEAGLSKVREKSAAPDDWQMQITVVSQSLEDRYNYAGVLASATDHIDRYDYPEPPAIGDFISLYFMQPDQKRGYSTDYRQSGADGYSYQFEVQSSTRQEKEIILHPESLPSDFEWALISLETNTYFKSETVKLSAQESRFKLIIGRESYVSDAISGLTALPTRFELTQNYPNPFNPKTIIRYKLPLATDVSIYIFNILGQKVRTLAPGVRQEAGTYFYEWDGINLHGESVASGIYILHLKTPQFERSIKMLLQR